MFLKLQGDTKKMSRIKILTKVTMLQQTTKYLLMRNFFLRTNFA